jgi:hypothetical protein
MRDGSQPGVPETNAVIERANQSALQGTILSLLRAGLPPIYWSIVAPCFCVLVNTDCTKEESARFRAQGEEFPGPAIPFGAKFSFEPAPTKNLTVGKWKEPSRPGAFAGYRVHPGYTWKGEFLCWDLTDFVDTDLSKAVRTLGPRIRNPHVTKRRLRWNGPLVFPLKARYEVINNTLEGLMAMRTKLGQDDLVDDVPPPLDPAIRAPVPLFVDPPPQPAPDPGGGPPAAPPPGAADARWRYPPR